MDWNIFLQVTLPMIGGFGWMIVRMDRKFDRIDTKFDNIQTTLNEINKDLRHIDVRLSRLEGGFTERGYWESREKKVGEK